MPADNMFNTSELRFVIRRDFDALQIAFPGMTRILQQRWVKAGTQMGAPLDDTNSEWRDVPMVDAP